MRHRMKSISFHDVFNLDNDNQPEETPTLIDSKDNVFIMFNRKKTWIKLIENDMRFLRVGESMVMDREIWRERIRLDLRFISDLVVVIVSATYGGIAFVCAGQPLCGGEASEGVFVGVFLSISSTAVVLKLDCTVGLLFALLPILGGTSGALRGMISMTKLLLVLVTFLTILAIMSRTLIPWLLKLMINLSSQTNELYQLASVAFCLLVAWCSDKLGLSLELGSFAAGLMISSTDPAHHTLEQVEPIRNFFAAFFLARFGYNNKTSLLVGMSLAQIGEFAFVLLSRASNLKLIEGKLYMLLLGTTSLSLVTTPLLFKLIPVVVHLGVLLWWFSPDSSSYEIRGESLSADSAKHITLMVIKSAKEVE
ncbi:hypothetical protein OROMI_005594 [Orobanche minor]